MSGISKRKQRGASLVEVITVTAIVMVLSGMAIMGTINPSKTSTANAAADQVVDALRQAREYAITKRRNVSITFTTPNTITTAVQPLPTDPPPPVFPTIQLNNNATGGLQFYLYPGLPNTPMGAFGFTNTSAISLVAANGGVVGNAIMFTTSGSLVGAGGAAAANYYAVGNNDPINATIFIGVPGTPASERAITVVGATGRVRSYYWTGTAWQQ
jgi:type II secretory pathway pseudopilin PulG